MFALNIIVYITLIPSFVVGLYLHLSYNIEKMIHRHTPFLYMYIYSQQVDIAKLRRKNGQ